MTLSIETPLQQAQAPGRGAAPEMRPVEGYWRGVWRRLRADRWAMASAVGLALLLMVIAAAPLISKHVLHVDDPNAIDLTDSFAGPGRRHLLGTDEVGRDTLTRLLYAGRVSLSVGFLGTFVATLVGSAVGMTAGYVGRWPDRVAMRCVEVVMSIPTIFLLILFSAAHPLGLTSANAVSLSLIIGLLGWTTAARLVRTQVLTLSERDYVLAAVSAGAGHLRLILRHILPHAMPVVVLLATAEVGAIIIVEAGLSYLGLGIQPPTPSWGNMLTNAQTYFYHSIWLVLGPGLMIVFTVLFLNVFGTALRDALDPASSRLTA